MIVSPIPYKPNEETAARITEMNADNFIMYAGKALKDCAEGATVSAEYNPVNEIAQTTYRQFYERAIELDCVDSFLDIVHSIEKENSGQGAGDLKEIRFWALPKPLQHKAENTSFPLNALPDVLKDYMAAVSKFGQVPPEMCALPLFSVLAMCCQGKCKVKNHKSSFTHELTLYTLTIASSGARKSPALSYFMKSVYNYQNDYNERHELERKQNQSERQFIEEQKRREMKKNNGNLERIKELDKQLEELPELRRLSLTITDVTPEALAQAMNESGGRIAIMDSEGGVLGTAAGMYNSGATNIDLLLKAYDGEFVDIRRKTSGVITLKRPLLTIGLLTQPKKLNEFINNAEFEEKGLLNRFLFAFPTAPKRYTDDVPEISAAAQIAYNELIKRLLSMPDSDTIIGHDRESALLFHDFHEYIQDCKQSGGLFEFIPNYAEKQLANALKIAALLHLCEHKPTEPINGTTAQAAIQITIWCFNQALRAFSGDVNENPVILTAYKVLEKMYNDKQAVYTFRDFKQAFHIKSDTDKEAELKEAIETLIDCYYIQDNGKKLGEKGYNMRLNPIVKPSRKLTKQTETD